jgi:cytochrome c551/c552
MKSFSRLRRPFKALCIALAFASATWANADDGVDVQKLLSAKGCVACHSKDKKIVGPAFHDVATKYAGDAQAASKVAANIRSGGVGRWGPVPMPPMSSLSDAEAAALAKFVLKQLASRIAYQGSAQRGSGVMPPNGKACAPSLMCEPRSDCTVACRVIYFA